TYDLKPMRYSNALKGQITLTQQHRLGIKTQNIQIYALKGQHNINLTASLRDKNTEWQNITSPINTPSKNLFSLPIVKLF
ncbi:MAG: hypothetical protein KBH03_07145, partial [Paludibacteraceae bacterium]|nr:hypothetical protein [Paludibacteraceae bacterium]